MRTTAAQRICFTQAFEGAHGVFLFTDFYVSAEMNAEKEILQGKNAIDAAAQARNLTEVCYQRLLVNDSLTLVYLGVPFPYNMLTECSNTIV